MFESAVKKLTLWYVGALFLVCLFFSIPTYTFASLQLGQAARRQTEIIRQFDGTIIQVPSRLSALRDEQLDHDRRQLLNNIILANLVILVLGAYLSYQFAKRTLTPIEEAHEAQARFTTDASHELRTPLAIMQAEIEVALRDPKFSAKDGKAILTSNLEEIARLRTLSEQLLNLTRLDRGKLQKTTVHLDKIVQKEVEHTEKHRHIDLEQTIQKNVQLSGDADLLRELVKILIDNAIRYAGDTPPRIAVTLKKTDSQTVLAITDHGIGIKASELPYVFDRFYRGSSATRHSATGHGLGLAIAKQIVDAHGGAITATSAPGKPTIFTVALPGASDSNPTAPLPSPRT
jgi:two-component system sensor histidine kinase CiaH